MMTFRRFSTIVTLFFVLLVLLLAACSDEGEKSESLVELAPAEALYPDFGSEWNDYVRISGSEAIDAECTSNFGPCTHGGEQRFVVATDQSDCTGLTATDDLNAFEWVCDDTTDPVRLVSTGLAEDASLSDLIDFATPGFEPNKVTVYVDGVAWGETPTSTWWSNPVEINNATAPFATPSTLYVVTSDPAATITIEESGIAVVVEPGVTATGPRTSANIIEASSLRRLWIEGRFDATGDDRGVNLYRSNHIVLLDVEVTGAAQHGIRFEVNTDASIVKNVTVNGNNTGLKLESASLNTFTNIVANGNVTGIHTSNTYSNTFTGVIANDNTQDGLFVDRTSGIATAQHYNTYADVVANNNGQEPYCCGSGIYVEQGGYNRFVGVTAQNNKYAGVFLRNGCRGNIVTDVNTHNNRYGVFFQNFCEDNVVTNITANHNEENALYAHGDQNSVFSGVTVNNNEMGVAFSLSAFSVLTKISSSNNARTGFGFFGGGNGDSNDHTFSDITSTDNQRPFELSFSSFNHFTGLLNLGNNTLGCSIGGVFTDPGLSGSACNLQGSSNAIRTTGLTVSDTFVGKVSTDDATNTIDDMGTADFPATPASFDWHRFEHGYRAWGIDGSDFPNADHRQRWTTGGGRIWDWSLRASDAVNREIVASIPTGDDTFTQVWFGTPETSDDDGCANEVLGSVWNGSACESEFLLDASEVMLDSIGNDNGLCESDETCLFMPNIGSYQGHGDLVSAGAFTDGALTGITLMRYEINGR